MLTATISVASAPARADVVLDGYELLPMSSVSDVLVARDGGELVLAGWEDEITVVDLASGAMSQVPGTLGMGSLSLSSDGSKLYGATRARGTVVEVDLESMTAHSWEVGGCPMDAVGRQGSVFYADAGVECWRGRTVLMQFDSGTGVIEPVGDDEYSYYDPEMVAVPGQDRFVVADDDGISSPRFALFDVASDGMPTLEQARTVGGYYGRVFVTDESDQLVLGRQLWSLPDLTQVGEGLPVEYATQVSSTFVTAPALSTVRVARRTDGQDVNVFRGPRQDGPDVTFVEAVLVGSTLYAVGDRDYGPSILYTSPDATTPAPVIAFTTDVPDPLYVGDHVLLRGEVTLEGVPVSGVPVTLTQIYPVRRVLGTAITDDSGTWALDHVAEPGRMVIDATYSHDGRAGTTTDVIYGSKRPTTMELTAPGLVAAEEPIEVEGVLYAEDSAPLPGHAVEIIHECLTPRAESASSEVTTDDRGRFTFRLIAGACDLYRFDATFAGTDERMRVTEYVGTSVDRAPSQVSVTAEPQEVLPGEDVTLTITVADGDGAPVPGATLSLTRRAPGGTETVTHPTTDATGTAVVTDTTTIEGSYQYTARWTGTPRLGSAYDYVAAVARRKETVLSVTGPNSAMVDESFTLTGSLTGAPLPASLIIEHSGGAVSTIQTAEDGTYSVPVSSTVGGRRFWRVRYAGDDLHAPSLAWAGVDITKLPTTVSVDGPATGTVGQPMTLTGQLEGVTGATKLVVTAPSGNTYTLTTEADGTFQDRVTPRSTGSKTWQITYPGNDRHQAAQDSVTVEVEPITPVLTLQSDRGTYTAGQIAEVFVDIAGSESRHVVVTAARFGGPPEVLFEGTVPDGGLNLSYLMDETRRFQVTTPADATHDSATTSIVRGVRLLLATEARRPIATSGRYAIYPSDAQPLFRTVASPPPATACIRHEVQRRSAGVWRTVLVSACTEPSLRGVTKWRLTKRQTPGPSQRVRAVFEGDEFHLRSRGKWAYFRFE